MKLVTLSVWILACVIVGGCAHTSTSVTGRKPVSAEDAALAEAIARDVTTCKAILRMDHSRHESDRCRKAFNFDKDSDILRRWKQAETKGWPGGQWLMAHHYGVLSQMFIRERNSNAEAYRQRIRLAADADFAPAINDLANFYQTESKRELLTRAAKMGDIDAMLSLGTFLYSGGVVTDEQFDTHPGVQWIVRAGQHGNPVAHYWLGEQNLRRNRVRQAVAAFTAAAELDYGLAIMRLAAIYERGQHVARDVQASRRLYTRAFELKYPLAELMLAELEYREGNEDEALAWCHRYEHQLLAPTFNLLGWMHENGLGGLEPCQVTADACYKKVWSADLRNLAEWFAQSDRPDDVARLGMLYEWGQGVRADIAQAYRLYTQAADAGHTGAMLRLARMYAHGRKDIPQSRRRSDEWVAKAARTGDARAVQLQQIVADGLLAFPDQATAELQQRHPDAMRVLLDESASRQNLLKIAAHSDASIRKRLVERPSLDEAVAIKLTADASADIRTVLASRSDLPQQALVMLSKDQDVSIAELVARKSDLSQPVLELIAQQGRLEARKLIARHTNLGGNAMLTLAGDAELAVRQQLLQRNDVSQASMERLARDSDVRIRSLLATRRELPLVITAQLAYDDDEEVRACIAGNNELFVGVLAVEQIMLGDDVTDTYSLQAALVRAIFNRTITDDHHGAFALTTKLAQDQSSAVRIALARRRHLPVTAALTMARQDELAVSRALASNTHGLPSGRELDTVIMQNPKGKPLPRRHGTAMGVTIHLAQSQHVEVRRALAANVPACTVEVASRLASDGDREVRAALAHNAAIGRWLPRELDDKPLEPRAAANLMVVNTLLKDEMAVRTALAGNTSLPFAILEHLACDSSAEVRRSVAANPKTHWHVLTVLQKDKDQAVRDAAGSNRSSPQGILTSLQGLSEISAYNVVLGLARSPALTHPQAIAIAMWLEQKSLAINLTSKQRGEFAEVARALMLNNRTPQAMREALREALRD